MKRAPYSASLTTNLSNGDRYWVGWWYDVGGRRRRVSLGSAKYLTEAGALREAQQRAAQAAVDDVKAATQAKAGESVLRSAAWFRDVTHGGLNPDRLRAAYLDGRITGRKAGRWLEYDVASVQSAYRDFAESIAMAVSTKESEANRGKTSRNEPKSASRARRDACEPGVER